MLRVKMSRPEQAELKNYRNKFKKKIKKMRIRGKTSSKYDCRIFAERYRTNFGVRKKLLVVFR